MITPTDKPDEFLQSFGEPIESVLNMATWHDGADLSLLYTALRQAVAESVEQEKRVCEPIRQQLFPRLKAGIDRYAPKCAGVYQLDPAQVEETHRNLLFNGATDCCDGTIVAHDSLLLSVVQIGIALVAYNGNQNTWVQRLYRRDLRNHYADPLEEAMALLDKRSQRESDNAEEPRDPLSRLIRRALMDYAERAALTELSTSIWRIGHGNPISVNMLMPTTPELLRAGLETLRKLLLEHKRFVYVASAPSDRLLLTIGNALGPLEFAIVDTLASQYTDRRISEMAASQTGHPKEHRLIADFLREARSEVIAGIYRAGKHAPARVFYAHRDFAFEAAAIAIADSTLQPYRGFPMLIDLADIVAGNTFDSGSFQGTLQDAYASAGEPTRYLGERETRT